MKIESYFDKFDEILYTILFFINVLVFVNLIIFFIGIKISVFVVIMEVLVLLVVFYFIFSKIRIKKRIDNLSYMVICVLAIVASFYIYLTKYFKVVKWDSASFLLNAKSFLTQGVLYESYKPLTWSSFLSTGLVFNLKEIIPLIVIIMFFSSVYLFSLELTKNKKISIVSLVLSAFIPVILLWGVEYYSETYLSMLITFGFAAYFHFNNSNKKLYYIASVFLFALSSLTKYNFILILIIPLIEMFRKRFWFSSTLPILIAYLPVFIYFQQKNNYFLYPFKSYPAPISYDIVKSLLLDTYYLKQIDSLFTLTILILVITGVIFLILNKRINNSYLFSFGLIFVLETIFFLGFYNFKDIRYFMFVVPLIATSVVYLFYETSNKAKRWWLFILLTTLMIIVLIFNFIFVIKPQYPNTDQDILQETAEYFSDIDENITSNSHVRMSWYLQRNVLRATEMAKLNEYIKQNNIKYIINFKYSGTPEYHNTTELLKYGELVKTFNGGVINIIKVNDTIK